MKSNIDAISRTPPWPAPQYLQRGRHRVAWRDLGAASETQAECWLLLHGGPGGGCRPAMLQPFDLARQRVIAIDQRGAGASRPRGRIQANHTAALVSDMEALRQALGLQRWSLFAGSWGTVPALLYAQRYPQHVQRLVLRGAFGLTRKEIAGLLVPGMRPGKTPGEARHIWPVRASTPLPVALLHLRQVLQSETPGAASLHVAREWALREMRDAAHGLRRSLRHGQGSDVRRAWAGLMREQRRAQVELLLPRLRAGDRLLRQRYRVQAHYLAHRGFVGAGGLDAAVLAVARQGLTVDWVHGRFDAICPPANSRRWAALGRSAGAQTRLLQPACGHLAGEPAMQQALLQCVTLAQTL
ncbi:alpha/beta fold hydrolase [Comamonas composti]|uniref:alpha/beta fold hydrolase n=1 Tax=Comamonas composti TaxID=408558 RepID=UPI00146FB837|nr:alpha/beta fold hydrolase [Comamonas composti]